MFVRFPNVLVGFCWADTLRKAIKIGKVVVRLQDVEPVWDGTTTDSCKHYFYPVYRCDKLCLI